ncbi:MAG TPA: hypothetical protein VEO96_09220 [Thermoplasmata archaeon]|nr:hypothetical protein [Thermoplasmata archaeon]
MTEGFVVADFLILLVPAMIAMLAFPLGLRWRGADHAVRAVYLFHRSGDPLATVASDFVPPIAADQLGPVLGAVRTFVDTPSEAREFHLTSERFGDEGLVAVHGRFVSACAVYRGSADGPLGRDLIRFVREFEAVNETHLGTWEDAASITRVASNAISVLVESRDASGPAVALTGAPSNDTPVRQRIGSTFSTTPA